MPPLDFFLASEYYLLALWRFIVYYTPISTYLKSFTNPRTIYLNQRTWPWNFPWGQGKTSFMSVLFGLYFLNQWSIFKSLSKYLLLWFPNSIITFKFIQVGLKETYLKGLRKELPDMEHIFFSLNTDNELLIFLKEFITFPVLLSPFPPNDWSTWSTLHLFL